ncbi:MAG: hypothetical protein WCO03_02245, partial [bacterium]
VYGTAGSADVFSLSSSTNARLFTVTASGRVGIGSVVPNELLEVNAGNIFIYDSGSANKGLRFQRGSGTSYWMTYTGGSLNWGGTGVSPATNGYLTLDAVNSRVGIGTTTPNDLLDIYTTTANTGAHVGNVFLGVWAGSNSYAAFTHNDIRGTAASYALLRSKVGTTYLKSASGRNLNFTINNAAQMQISSTGNLGIGTTAQTSKLTVVDAGNVHIDYGTADFMANNLTRGVSIGYQGISATGTLAAADLSLNSKGTGKIVMQTVGTGNVGIGTSSPSSKLDLWGNLNVATGSTPALFVNTANSQVGIGYNTPGAPLSFGRSVGSKIGLYDSNGSDIYGFGIQGGLLQIYAPVATNRIGLGYGTSASFTEVLTVKGANVGVGTTSPGTKLDVWGNLSVGTSSVPTLIADTARGSVAIGTSTPTAKLDVWGNINNQLQAPTLVASTQLGLSSGFNTGRSQSLVVGSEYAYITDSASSTLAVYSIASTSITFIATSTVITPLSMKMSGNYLYILNTSALVVMDITNPRLPVLIASSSNNITASGVAGRIGPVNRMALSGKYLFITSGYDGGVKTRMDVYDISNPYNPVVVKSVTNASYLTDSLIVANGNYAYTLTTGYGTAQLATWDISDPKATVLKGTLAIPSSAKAIDLVYSNGFVYVGGGQYNPYVSQIDVGNPASPVFLATSTAATPAAVYVSGKYLFVGTLYSANVYIYDISNPRNLSLITTLNAGSSDTSQIFVQGKYLYLVDQENSYFRKFSLTNTDVPSLLTGAANIGKLDVSSIATFFDNVFANSNLSVLGSAIINKGLSVVASTSVSYIGGLLGIGTTTPVAKLDIYGTAGSADIFAISSSSNARLLTVTAAGNVGIGTT